MDQTNDAELFQAWAAGGASAGEQLIGRHYQAVARFFSNKVMREPEELIQRTFLRCVEQKARFRGDSSFRTFVFGVARNVLLEYFREKRRQNEREQDKGLTSAHALDPTPSQLLAERRETGLLLEALRHIDLEHQMLLELFYWEGLSTRELADALDVPQGTIKGRLVRARRELALHREHLAKQWGCVTQPLEDELEQVASSRRLSWPAS